MNEQISWDPSLVKKFGSSNHFKLLNQLRNEVKKYPIKRKKKILNDQNINPTNSLNNNSISLSTIEPTSSSKNKNIISQENDTNSDKVNDTTNINKPLIESTISFNNSKNFNIYNSINNKEDFEKSDEYNNKISENLSTFKDRLNQIDMK